MKSITEIKVRAYHTDLFGHVNHARYIEFLEEGRWSYFENNGQLMDQFDEKGIGHAMVNLNINYRKGAVLGDTLQVETGVRRASKRSVTMFQNICLSNSNEIIAEAEVTLVYFDSKKKEVIPTTNVNLRSWQDLQDVIIEKEQEE